MTDRLDHALSRAVEAALAAGADDVEASYAGTETQFTRFASSRFTQVGQTWSDTLRIRALIDGRMGAQVCASLNDDAVTAGAAAAVEAARLSPELDVALRFNTGEEHPAPETSRLPDDVTAVRVPATAAAAFARHAEAGVTFAGAVKAYRHQLGVRTAGGLARRFEHCTVDAQMIGLTDSSSGYAGWTGAPDGGIDLDTLAATAADKALRSRDAVELEPGAFDVVLAPEAVAELLEWMAAASFSATSVLDGTSLLAGRRGETVCDERITLSDEPGPNEPAFDAEGTLRRKVVFIDAGRAGEPVSDRITALRLGDGHESTGHAPNVADSFGGLAPAITHLHLAPGDADDDQLIAAVDRGLYITRFHYVNGLLDTRSATMTGMTRDGTFLIENGQLGRGVRNMRFTQPMLEAFSRLGGLGRTRKDVPSWWSEGGVITTPAVLLRQFRFTGKSR